MRAGRVVGRRREGWGAVHQSRGSQQELLVHPLNAVSGCSVGLSLVIRALWVCIGHTMPIAEVLSFEAKPNSNLPCFFAQ